MYIASLYFPCWVQSISLVTPVRFCMTEIWFPWIYILFVKLFFLWNYILYTMKCTCQPPVISICLLYIYKLLIHYLFCILTGRNMERVVHCEHNLISLLGLHSIPLQLILWWVPGCPVVIYFLNVPCQVKFHNNNSGSRLTIYSHISWVILSWHLMSWWNCSKNRMWCL